MADRYKVPEPTKGDTVHTIVRAGLSAVPVAGGPAVELLASVIRPPLAKRLDEWMHSVSEGLIELEAKKGTFDVKQLEANDAFVSAVLHATQVASRNHHKEKLEALRNAVLNVACGTAPNEDFQLMFIHLVDTLTPWHIRILLVFQDPSKQHELRGLPRPTANMLPATMLENMYPELRDRRFFYDLIAKELSSRGLLTTDSLHVQMTAAGPLAKLTTEFGDEFIRFITSPSSAS